MQVVSTTRRRSLNFKRLVLAQVITTLALIMIAIGMSGVEASLAALLGGMVSILPSLYFFWRGTRRGSQHNVLNLYQAAIGKFGLTVALFALVFALVPLSNPAYFFVAYVVAQLMHWLAPWLLQERSTP